MKLTALAVTAIFISAPALAQGYGTPDAGNNPSAAVPATPATPATPSANANDDTRVASNQAKHRQHKKSSTQDQMSTSPAQSPDSSASPPAPMPQQ